MNQLEPAEAIALHALELIIPWENPTSTCAAHLSLARIFIAQGKLEQATTALANAAAAIQGRAPTSDVFSELNAAKIKLWLLKGDLLSATQWADDYTTRRVSDKTFTIPREQDELTLSRVMIANREYNPAFELLSPLAKESKLGGRSYRVVENLILQAVALVNQDRVPQALDVMQESLVLAQPEGYIRLFIDEGEPVTQILKHLAGRELSIPLRDYVIRLINQ